MDTASGCLIPRSWATTPPPTCVWQAWVALIHLGECTQKDLSDFCRVSVRSVQRALVFLERENLLEISCGDWREHRIYRIAQQKRRGDKSVTPRTTNLSPHKRDAEPMTRQDCHPTDDRSVMPLFDGTVIVECLSKDKPIINPPKAPPESDPFLQRVADLFNEAISEAEEAGVPRTARKLPKCESMGPPREKAAKRLVREVGKDENAVRDFFRKAVNNPVWRNRDWTISSFSWFITAKNSSGDERIWHILEMEESWEELRDSNWRPKSLPFSTAQNIAEAMDSFENRGYAHD